MKQKGWWYYYDNKTIPIMNCCSKKGFIVKKNRHTLDHNIYNNKSEDINRGNFDTK